MQQSNVLSTSLVCCVITMLPLEAVLSQTAPSFQRDLLKLGFLSTVERTGDSVVITTGPKFQYISVPQARAEFCQRFLAHVRLSAASVTSITLRTLGGDILGTCSGDGYRAAE